MWGLAFKPDTDDIREAPALYIIEELLKEGAVISAYDPEAMHNVRNLIGDKITYAIDEYDALRDADLLLIATEWSLFRTPNFEKVTSLLKNKVIFDEVQKVTEILDAIKLGVDQNRDNNGQFILTGSS